MLRDQLIYVWHQWQCLGNNFTWLSVVRCARDQLGTEDDAEEIKCGNRRLNRSFMDYGYMRKKQTKWESEHYDMSQLINIEFISG